MSEIVSASSSMSEDETLAFTQGVRKQLIQKIVKKMVSNAPGEMGDVDVDKSDKTLLTALLDGMDRQTLTVKRINVEEKAAQDMGATTAMIATLLTRLPNRPQTADQVIEGARVVGFDEDVPAPELVPGETEIAAPQLSFDSFMSDTAKSLG